ncbi:hypothetical protein OSR40_010020 [Serratia rubidaea]|uniref:hypothetical protein n=1 Tax=Serratia rubidaea TaxID=61652 RepID=UPI0023B1450D|nr:hypothetical protein [Serratia rubidaea]MDK1704065.1 hypothetical protein [Serratia rubidaea]
MNSFAEMAQPGVSFTQQIIDISRREKPTALPVFIGYSDAENVQGELTAVSSLQEFYHLFGQSPPGSGYLLDAMRLYFAHGGGRCHVLALTPGDDGPAAQDYDGITDIIANEPDITLLVLPDIVLLEPASWQQVVSGVGQCCAENLNLFALIDYPSAPQDAQACRQLDIGPYGMHMAGYWPWVIFEEDAATRLPMSRAVPPSAAVAAVLQGNDKVRGIWKAPANIRLDKVIKLNDDHHTRVEMFFADPRQGCSVNQIRSFPGRGIKIWGCRTLSMSTDVSQLYVQNQRLLKWIKTTLSEAMRPYVYEPNNEITWYRLHALIRSRLKALWEQGGLAGATEEEAYQISVGSDDYMDENDVENGLLRCRASVAIQQPVEFIHINLDLWLGQRQVERGEAAS